MYKSIIPNITDTSMIGETIREEKVVLESALKTKTDYTKILYIVCIVLFVILLILLIYYMYSYYSRPTEKKEIKIKDKITKPEIKLEQKGGSDKNNIPDNIMNMDNSVLQQYITKKSNKPLSETKETSRSIEQKTISTNINDQITDNSDNIIKTEEKKIQSLKDNKENTENWDDVEEPIAINREEETMLMIQEMMSENKNRIVIVTDHNILNNTSLLTNDNNDNNEDDEDEETCSHIFKSGINKGKQCGNKAIIENKCSKHH